MNYFIVTPSKNEEQNISRLIRLIEKQTIKPFLWVIVDESTDGTKEIINKTTDKYEWVKAIYLQTGEGYLGIKYGIACKAGFDYAIEYCRLHEIENYYIGLIDADVIIERDLFEKLMVEFEKEPELGIASGSEYWEISGKLVSAGTRIDLPMGPVRMWRKKCFEVTGGYMAVACPDSVSNVKAKLRDWKTMQFNELKVVTRRTSTARGFWWGAVEDGKTYYYLNFHPIIILLKSIKYSLKYPYYTGFGLIKGYFSCLIRKKKKIDDAEIEYYYRYIRPKEIFRYYLDIFKKKGN